MSISMPRELFPQIHEDKEINPASRRKVVLPHIAQKIMEAQGYKFGSKIRIPGGYAFEVVDPKGNAIKIGLKTGVNRWLNTSTSLVERVDLVIVTTFVWDDNDEKPDQLELIAVESEKLLDMISKVKKAVKKKGWDWSPNYYMPIDLENVDDSPGCAGSALMDYATTIFGPTKVKWVNAKWGSLGDFSEASAAAEVSISTIGNVDTPSIIAHAKAELSQKLGVSPLNIEISVRY